MVRWLHNLDRFLVKAVMEGKKTIKAYRFESYLKPETPSEK